MHIPDDFIPDFSCKFITGSICNRNSKIQCAGKNCYVSLNNKINLWNLNSAELIESFGTRNVIVTCFYVREKEIFIGYDDGCIEIVKNNESKIMKLHNKKVTGFLIFEETLVSASMDGTISCYDLTLEEVKFYYKGNNIAVENILSIGKESFCAICTDRCARIWKFSSETINDAIAFDSNIFSAVFRGNEGLFFLSSGDSFFVNITTKEKKPFEKFKNLRNVVSKENIIGVQSQKKIAIFEATGESTLKLRLLKKFETSSDFFNFDLVEQVPCFISKQNKIVFGENKIEFGFHSEEILGLITNRSKIYSLSKDKLVCWDRNVDSENVDEEESAESLSLSQIFKIGNARCFTLFDDKIVIGTSDAIIAIDRKLFEKQYEIKAEKISSICASEDILAVSSEATVAFYDRNLQVIKTLNTPETIVYSRFSPDQNSFFCSCLDNKIYQFVFDSLELRITFYGHSLPVRYFSISPDQKLLASCGADKLVKLWGIEFGDCRKTFVGDSQSVEFFNETLFAFAGKTIEYYNYFEKLKQFKVFGSGFVSPGTDYFVCSIGKGLGLFGMKKYELIGEEDSEELKNVTIKGIVSLRDYDMFLDHLERLETDFTEQSIMQFYDFLGKIDFNELKEYLYVIDHLSITIMLQVILRCIEKNTVLNLRLFSILLKNHKDMIVGTEVFNQIYTRLLEKTREIRDLYNINLAKLEIELNEVEIDI